MTGNVVSFRKKNITVEGARQDLIDDLSENNITDLLVGAKYSDGSYNVYFSEIEFGDLLTIREILSKEIDKRLVKL